MAGSARSGGFDEEGGGMIADINVTPLVDITLVLLIIMMVAAPIIANNPSIKVEYRNVRRTGVSHVGAMPIGRDVHEVGAAVNADRRHDFVLLGVNHADVRGASVDHVHFISFGIGRNSSRFRTNGEIAHHLKRAQVNHCDGVAFVIGDVSVLAIARSPGRQAALVEIPPAARKGQRYEYGDEEEFAHRRYGLAEGKRL